MFKEDSVSYLRPVWSKSNTKTRNAPGPPDSLTASVDNSNAASRKSDKHRERTDGTEEDQARRREEVVWHAERRTRRADVSFEKENIELRRPSAGNVMREDDGMSTPCRMLHALKYKATLNGRGTSLNATSCSGFHSSARPMRPLICPTDCCRLHCSASEGRPLRSSRRGSIAQHAWRRKVPNKLISTL